MDATFGWTMMMDFFRLLFLSRVRNDDDDDLAEEDEARSRL